MQFRTCENFRTSTDLSLVESPKIFTNTKATPQNTSIAITLTQIDYKPTQIAESALDFTPSTQEANSKIVDEFLGLC